MTWLTDNKKFAVYLTIVGLIVLIVILDALKIPTNNELWTVLQTLLVLGVKEWLDGKPDTK